MGVIAVTDIDYGQIFGPFPSYLTSTDPAYVIGLLTNDKHPDGVVLKIDTNDWRERMGAVDWLPYVSSARDEEEQNMEAYPKEGCIFYRTLRIVRAGEELLVWYSKDFTLILAVPELNTNSKRDDEQFICTHCGEMFEFPFPLRAHLKFKCAFASEENLYNKRSNLPQPSPGSYRNHNAIPATEDRRDSIRSEMKNNKIIMPYCENNNKMITRNDSNTFSPFIVSHRKRQSDDEESDNTTGNTAIPPPIKIKATSVTEKPMKKRDSLNSYSIENLSKSHVKEETKLVKGEEDDDEDEERGKEEEATSTSPHYQTPSRRSQIHSHDSQNYTCSQVVTENVSAFRKVEKSPHRNGNLNLSDNNRSSPVPSISSINSSSSSSSSPPPLSKSATSPKAIKQSATTPPPSQPPPSQPPPSQPPPSQPPRLHLQPHDLSLPTQNSHTNSRMSYGQASDSILHPNHKESPHISFEPSTSSFLHPSKRPHPPHPHPIKPILPTASSDGKPPHLSQMANHSLMSMYMPRIPILPPQPSPLRLPPTVVSNFLAQTSSGSINTSVAGVGGGGRGRANGSGSSRIPLPVPHSAFPAADQIPPGLLEMCRATIPTVGPLTESFVANIRNGNIQATLNKQALFADRHISSLSFLKSANPMVEKLLQTTNPTLLSSPINAMNLSQNWCAKCNATFRMTSDLVYHMRSHHKREFDPMKKKREEKLRCNICNETFRERHHLTRHMSSHA